MASYAHFALISSCAAAKRSAEAGDASSDFIAATSKKCPQCGYGISHFHGHACHHIRPGGGCPKCGHHFCYCCLGAFNACGCRYQGSTFCNVGPDLKSHVVLVPYPHDSRCGCPICPQCRPGKQCEQCDGNCGVCLGLVEPGPTEIRGASLQREAPTHGEVSE